MSGSRYRIEYSKDAAKNIKKFPKNIQERIIRAIENRLCVYPEEVGKPLLNQWREHRRLRVGDYRIIYKIYQETIVVFIVEVDHRKDVYGD